MQAMRDCESVVSYLHLPVQSGANSCLKRMARGYTADSYLRLVDRVRTVVPKVELATDIIVGFSGETEAEFQATVELVRRVEFVQAFVFKYSNRPGTAADRVQPDDVPEEVKKHRNQEILRIQGEIQFYKKPIRNFLTSNARRRLTRNSPMPKAMHPLIQ